MKKKIIRFTIFVAVFLLIGIIFWKKINKKSEEEIFQEKVEQFYENQESFEKIVAYINGYNYHQITENNKMWTDVIINGVTFRLEEWRNNYTLSLYSRKESLSQLLNDDEYTSFINVIGEESSMEICYDKKSYTVKFIVFKFFKVIKCLINCYDNHIILYKATKRKRWKDDSVFLQIKMIYALVYCLLSVLLRFLQENDESDVYSIIL